MVPMASTMSEFPFVIPINFIITLSHYHIITLSHYHIITLPMSSLSTFCIIGPGLIGGSMAKDLRQKGLAKRIVGVEHKPENARRAIALGLVDEVMPLPAAVAASDVIIVATPVDGLAGLMPFILDLVTEQQLIMDVGSTKVAVLEAVKDHPKRHRFVATHPMAGTEFSGPEAAIAGLFEGKCCVFSEADHSADDAVRDAEHIYTAIGMHIVHLDGPAHDLHVAYVSHISHIVSFALALTVLEKEKDEARIFELASGGFHSTVRLAKSNPRTWTPIFKQNCSNVLDVLEEFIQTIGRFRTLLQEGDFAAVERMMEQANDIRRVLDPVSPHLMQGADGELEALRRDIDLIDHHLFDLLARRMQVSKAIGHYKKKHNMPIVQNTHWNTVLEKGFARGRSRGLGDQFVEAVLNAIHCESIRHQKQVIG